MLLKDSSSNLRTGTVKGDRHRPIRQLSATPRLGIMSIQDIDRYFQSCPPLHLPKEIAACYLLDALRYQDSYGLELKERLIQHYPSYRLSDTVLYDAVSILERAGAIDSYRQKAVGKKGRPRRMYSIVPSRRGEIEALARLWRQHYQFLEPVPQWVLEVQETMQGILFVFSLELNWGKSLSIAAIEKKLMEKLPRCQLSTEIVESAIADLEKRGWLASRREANQKPLYFLSPTHRIEVNRAVKSWQGSRLFASNPKGIFLSQQATVSYILGQLLVEPESYNAALIEQVQVDFPLFRLSDTIATQALDFLLQQRVISSYPKERTGRPGSPCRLYRLQPHCARLAADLAQLWPHYLQQITPHKLLAA